MSKITVGELISELVEEIYALLEGWDDSDPYPELNSKEKRKKRISEIQKEIDRRLKK